MNLILRYLEGRKSAPGVNPKLTQELKETRQQLSSILNKWNWDGTSPKNATEFLNKFAPWVDQQLADKKELKVFLAKKGVSSLAELASLPTSESEQLKFYRENIKIKEQIIEGYKNQEQTWQHTEEDYLSRIEELKTNRETSEELEQVRKELAEAQQELAQQKQTFLNTEADYLARIEAQDQELKDKVKEFQASNGGLLKRIEELKAGRELPEDYEDLISERDEAIREKRTLEQEILATNNRLNLKQQEVSNKEQALEKLKRERNQLEVQQQKALQEKNTLITTLNQEIKQHKDKYSKQGKLLDTEQLECKKLEAENEKLTKENQELTQQNIKMGQRLLELDPPTEVNC